MTCNRMTNHARLGPSNHRWVHCPGSIREETNYPDTSGKAAIDGTGSHLLLELCLTNNTCAESFIGETIEQDGHKWLIKQDRCDRVNVCLEYVEARKEELSTFYPACEITIEVETISNPGSYVGRDDWWGTVDITLKVAIGGKIRFIEVIDYKDGRTFVDSRNNSQLISYLFGKTGPLIDKIDCRMTIVQPKTNNPVRYENKDSFEVYVEAMIIWDAAKKTDDPEAPLVPDNKNGNGYCMWCKHRDNCTARKDQLIGGMGVFTNTTKTEGLSLFETIEQTFKDVTTMTDDVLSQMLDAKPVIEDVFKRAEEEAKSRLGKGLFIPGYAMLPGNSKKKWNISEEELVKKLKSCNLKKGDIYIQTLISPAQVLKHSTLTKKQKERIEKDYISLEAGAKKLKTRSNREEQKEIVDGLNKFVVQCNTSRISFL